MQIYLYKWVECPLGGQRSGNMHLMRWLYSTSQNAQATWPKHKEATFGALCAMWSKCAQGVERGGKGRVVNGWCMASGGLTVG